MPIGALDGERKADEEVVAWPGHARTTMLAANEMPVPAYFP